MLDRSLRTELMEFDSVYAELGKFFAGRSVLVAGADGFLGRSCQAILAELGARVTAAGRRKNPESPAGVQRLCSDFANSEAAAAAVHSQTIVLDCIGSAGSIASNRNPGQNLHDECLPHLNLFDACAKSPLSPTIVFLSSRLVYGPPVSLPVDERHPLQAQSFYAAHKLNVENYLHVYEHSHGLPFVILRLSNPYGPHVPAHDRDYGVINRFIRDALKGRTLTLYGDGAQLRDYIYIEDAVVAMLATAMVRECHGDTFNLGGPHPISIRDAVKCIVDLTGNQDVVRFVPWPKDALCVETGDYWTDFSKLCDRIKLPEQVDFREGVCRTIARLQNPEVMT
ncbi:putative NAD-dependent epimerase/dehydratase [uncultured Woeseiaceae bacterium]|uniref:Putative NAD-dependent epimerase/dehydratase n=1 Tax=uncultured Woeseiaceae bacterium TaxID=1983305 RepID=A0A7D9H8X5_9GAMM|nr:putative NAD-dependent epimerase/dehydratase [uncultured Woeseiaceae bacterium]